MRRKWLLGIALALAFLPPSTAAAADEEAKLVKRPLEGTETIQGIACRDQAWLREDGSLDSCFLAEDQTIDAQLLPARTRVALDREGHLDWVFLPETTEVQGHRCRGGGHDFMTGFHPDGRLRLCWLETDEMIEDVPCAKSTIPGEMWRALFSRNRQSGVYFHPDGKLQSCRLSQDLTRADRRHDAGSRIELDAEGRAASAGATKPPAGRS